uniref:NADH-ubiquinone oxidoreductase chain 5 n=1 Tax=Conaspidia wangi TaxID=2675281 RepID=A0A8E5BUS5_9HYME|nr:NADH dehydrogenase subunit 5 [Conaspidia wangi]QSZ78257.1 NADH dehydrogenase subunit 5 [Conaspidia wangi]
MFLDICIIFMLIMFIFSMSFFILSIFFLMKNMNIFIEYSIFDYNSVQIAMTLYFDWMSLMFLSIVLFISSSVVFYSKYYMDNDLKKNRFISLVLLFVLSMMLLIISPNLISILLGWDGLGLISYCLVIYYQNKKSFNAGMLTVLSNRIGDVFLLMSIAWMMNYGSWNFIFWMNYLENSNEMVLIMIFISLSAFTKSAQIPFSSWLPAAMAAPTPVSSLVHSSTLVTVGVYLMIRFEKLIMNMNYVNWLLLLSVLTMFMSGLNASFEFDLKKVIALSTLSQLGMMMMILFMGYSELAFFHLLTHALFKALLFMCAGLLIHNLMNFQDIRLMGCICLQMPLVSICFNISNLALCGFPFLAGFYSKDLILEMTMMEGYNFYIMFMIMISILLTVIYTFRLVYFSMIMSFNMLSLNFLNDNSWSMNKSLLGLLFMVVLGGTCLSWMVFPYPYMVCLPMYLKIIPLIMIIMGSYIGYLMFNLKYKKNYMNFLNLKNFFSLMWFLPIISTYGMVKQSMLLSMKMSLMMDQGWTEFFLGREIYKLLIKNSSMLDLLFFYFNKLLSLMFLVIFTWWYLNILLK